MSRYEDLGFTPEEEAKIREELKKINVSKVSPRVIRSEKRKGKSRDNN